jgi:hypothetical protein
MNKLFLFLLIFFVFSQFAIAQVSSTVPIVPSLYYSASVNTFPNDLYDFIANLGIFQVSAFLPTIPNNSITTMFGLYISCITVSKNNTYVELFPCFINYLFNISKNDNLALFVGFQASLLNIGISYRNNVSIFWTPDFDLKVGLNTTFISYIIGSKYIFDFSNNAILNYNIIFYTGIVFHFGESYSSCTLP